jgi:CBS domain containing-hemolysin-like protein
MKTKKVKDVMVTLSEYATVPKGATLHDAVMTLRKVQLEFDKNHYHHRAILVYDGELNNIVGKISQMDILRGLEPQYREIMSEKDSLTRFGFSYQFQKTLLEKFDLWGKPLNDICQKSAGKKVEEFMYSLQEGEYVEADTGLNKAIHQLVMGQHQSLLVRESKKIIGILRLSDVFIEVCEAISTSKI